MLDEGRNNDNNNIAEIMLTFDQILQSSAAELQVLGLFTSCWLAGIGM
jgi:hypothetical protein